MSSAHLEQVSVNRRAQPRATHATIMRRCGGQMRSSNYRRLAQVTPKLTPRAHRRCRHVRCAHPRSHGAWLRMTDCYPMVLAGPGEWTTLDGGPCLAHRKRIGQLLSDGALATVRSLIPVRRARFDGGGPAISVSAGTTSRKAALHIRGLWVGEQ